MAGSTGGFSRKIIQPTTGRAEQNKEIQSSLDDYPGLHEGVRMIEGTISEVHQDKPMIKAYSDDKNKIANDKWIVLGHSPREIAERFGTIKPGLRVYIFYSGPDGSKAIAFIIGELGEKNVNTPVFPNLVKLGFSFFPPGKGI